MRYPASFIERVKGHFRLSEVIGRRIALQRRGREHVACCPFHQEATPSFTINDEKGFYHCFGCGAHGDAVTFLMEHDRLHYVEAIELLANDAGIEIPKPDIATQQRYNREEKLLELMEAAHRWFMQQLHSSIGHSAREYLQQRGIKADTIAEFGIGYAPQQREGLKFAMQQQGYSEQQMLDAGLLIKVDDKPSYDRFRGRVMFPIARTDGKIIAFGGRLLEKSDYAPKYLNSPETLLFKKHDVLFNLHNVRKLAHDAPYLIVVEGYTDAISLHAAGLPYAVAPLGTAFGESHLQLLWRYHPNPILCFDGDRAGQKAMLRAADIILPHIKADRLVRFCGLPAGEDPDSFVRGSGVAALETLLKRALSISELLWNVYIGNRQFSTPESLASAEQKLMDAVSLINDNHLRRRIISAYQNRLWHISKQQLSKHYTAMTPISAGNATMHLQKNIQKQNSLPLEQIFALVMRYPALLHDAEVEHALYEWDWRQTYYHAAITDILSQIEALANCRYIIAEFLTREFPALDVYLQKQYTTGIIPIALYGKEEAEGLPEARLLFRKLKQKMERIQMMQELEKLARSNTSGMDEQQQSQLLELIKLQQKTHLVTSGTLDDSYI